MSKHNRKRQIEAAAIGRPRANEGEAMVLGNDVLASMLSPAQGGVYFLSTDEIIKRKGWSTYKEMLNDDQVKACLEFKKVLVSGRKWEIAPEKEGDAEAEKQAKFASEVLCRIGADRTLREALTAFEFGYSLAEQVFTRDVWDEDGQQYVFLKKLQHRDPKELQLKTDYHGNFMGAKQFGVAGVPNNLIELTPDKLWLFTHDKRFGNLYGNSDLRAAYRPWFAKKFILQFWNVFLERFGAPMTKMTYPAGASEDLKQKLKQILQNLASKTEILVPSGVEINLIEATRGGNAGYGDAVNLQNTSIARAILMVGMIGADGEANRSTAADSQSFLHLRVLFKLCDQISNALSASLMEQVIYPLLEVNFEKPTKPKFIWQDYGQYEGMKVADEIRQLHAAGIIDMDQEDVNYLRSVVGLPIRDEDDKPDDVVRPPPLPTPGNANAPPPAAPQGNDRAGKAGGAQTGDK